MQFGIVLFWLVFGHFLADYCLQIDFIARGKDPTKEGLAVPWYYTMMAHCFVHGGMVVFFTGSLLLGLLEIVIHFLTDWAKCKGLIGVHTDQWIHLGCKLIWAIAIVWMVGSPLLPTPAM